MFDDLRSAWGARAVKPSDLVYVAPSRRTEFFSHWNGGPTGLTASDPHSACLAAVKSDQAYHIDSNGWVDVGYNGLVCPHGRAIEGRGIDYSGAHCPDHNTTGYGWQFMIGKGETATPLMFARMARAYADCVTRSGHSLAKKGHRDGYATECPGDQIEAWVKAGMPAPAAVEEDMASSDEILRILNALRQEEANRYGVYTGRNSDLVNRIDRVFAAVGDQELEKAAADRYADIARRVDAVTAAVLAALGPQVQKAVQDALATEYDAQVVLTPKEG